MVRFRALPPNPDNMPSPVASEEISLAHKQPALGLARAPVPSHAPAVEVGASAADVIKVEPKSLLEVPLLVQVPIPMNGMEATENVVVAKKARNSTSPLVRARRVKKHSVRNSVAKKPAIKIAKKVSPSIKVSRTAPKSPMSALEALAELYVENSSEGLTPHRATAVKVANVVSDEKLDTLVEQSFSEPSLSGEIASEWSQSSATLEADEATEAQVPLIPRSSMILGSFQKEEYVDYQKSLDAFKKVKLPTLAPAPKAIEEKDLLADKEPVVEPAKVAEVEAPKVETTLVAKAEVAEVKAPVVEDSQAEITVPSEEVEIAEAIIEPKGEPTLVRPDKPRAPWTKPVEEPTQSSAPELVAPTKTVVAIASPTIPVFTPVAPAPQMTNQLIKPKVEAIQKPAPVVATQPQPSIKEEEEDELGEVAPVSRVEHFAKALEAPDVKEVPEERVAEEVAAEVAAPPVAAIIQSSLPNKAVTVAQAEKPAPTLVERHQTVAPKAEVVHEVAEPVTHAPQTIAMATGLPKARTPASLASSASSSGSKTQTQIVWDRPDREASERAASRPRSTDPDVGILNGKFSVDKFAEQWLAENHGHIELFIQPADRADLKKGDIDGIGYIYRSSADQRNFYIPSKRLKSGLFKLRALVFDEHQLRADISFRDRIWWGYKADIEFHVRGTDIEHYQTFVQNVPSNGLVMNLTLFEGPPPDDSDPDSRDELENQPVRIPNATVTVVNMPRLGTFLSDKDGNVRIPHIPSRSELTVAVSAPGNLEKHYLSTQQEVPVGNKDAYDVIYLVPQSKVDDITYFTQKKNRAQTKFIRTPQSGDKGLVFAKVYDPVTRLPQAGVTVGTATGDGTVTYHATLPDPDAQATLKQGLTSILNMTPWFTALVRPGGWLPYLVNVKPNQARYVEFGRSGMHSLHGQVHDLLNGTNPRGADVHLVFQDAKNRVSTDANGEFWIHNIDHPQGTLTVEILLEGYPKFLQTIPWDPSAPPTKEPHHFFLIDQELYKDSVLDIARLKSIDTHAGSIMGGAEPSLFASKEDHENPEAERCFTVQLESTKSDVPITGHGPYPWGKPSEGNKFCLNAANPRFGFYNLPPDVYFLKWIDPESHIRRAHTLVVGVDRVSMVIN